MDQVTLYTEDMEFKIIIDKKKKPFSLSKFGQYNCTISFYNNLELPVLVINCSEKELYSCIQVLAQFNANLSVCSSDTELSSIINFNTSGDFRDYFWMINTINLMNYPEYPTEDEIMMSISIFESHMNENVLRLYLPMTYGFLDILIYHIYLVLEDLPYLDEINEECYKEYLERGDIRLCF